MATTLSRGGIRTLAARGKARAFDIGDGLWIDVDDDAAYLRAEGLFVQETQARLTGAIARCEAGK